MGGSESVDRELPAPISVHPALEPCDIADAIASSARHAREAHHTAGWRGDSTGYYLRNFPADVADLARLLEREPTDGELRELERAIRVELGRA